MDKMKMHTPDLVNKHIEQIAQLFPDAVRLIYKFLTK